VFRLKFVGSTGSGGQKKDSPVLNEATNIFDFLSWKCVFIVQKIVEIYLFELLAMIIT